MKPVAILGGVRLPFCRSGTAYSQISGFDLMRECFSGLVKRFELKGQRVGEVALGTTFYHPSHWNLARDVVLKSEISPLSPAMGVQRACATSLDAAISVALKISAGVIDCGIAGGTESISNVALYLKPEVSHRLTTLNRAKSLKDKAFALKGFRLNEILPEAPPAYEPTTGRSMGEHAEQMAKTWSISRKAQDELALASHRNGAAAYARGFYSDLVLPFAGVTRDNNLRTDTSLDKLAALKPAFDKSGAGTLTAGNSSPLTDGAAAVFLASEEWAKRHRFPVRAYLTDFETAAINLKEEGLLMAPAYAVPRMLKRQGLGLDQFDFYELHEAFAAQVLCTLKAWESDDYCKKNLGTEGALGTIPFHKLNVAGGSVALGHPFGATGSRILATLAALLDEKGSGRGLVSICTGGGMGTVAILEK